MSDKLLNYKNEIYRKLIHLASLIFPLIYFFTDYIFFVPFLFFISLFIIVINKNYINFFSHYSIFKYFISDVIRKYESTSLWGATYLIIGFLFISFFFDKHIVITSMLITSISDSLAAIFGIKYGKIRIFNDKSIEGLYIFIITTFTILYFSLSLSIAYLLIISILVAITELLTPTRYDNLSIPIISSLTIYISLI